MPDAVMNPLAEGAAELDAYAHFQKLKSSVGDQTAKFAGAVEKGSKEAYSAIVQYQAEGPQNVQEQMKALMEQAKAQREEQIRVGKDVMRAVKDIDVKVRGI